MASTLSNITCSGNISATLSNLNQGATATASAQAAAFSLTLSAGTGANQADLLYQEVDRALNSGSNDDLDVYDLAVFDQTTDVLGQTVTFAEIVAIGIRNQSTSVGNLVFGGEGTAAAWNSFFSASDTSTCTIHPGGFMVFANPNDPGYDVTDTSNHLLRINASGGNITYDITILGRSA